MLYSVKNLKSRIEYLTSKLRLEELLKKSKYQVKNKIFRTKFLKIINIARFTDQKDHSTLIEAIKIVSKKAYRDYQKEEREEFKERIEVLDERYNRYNKCIN